MKKMSVRLSGAGGNISAKKYAKTSALNSLVRRAHFGSYAVISQEQFSSNSAQTNADRR